MFICDFLVDGPKICCAVDTRRSGFQVGDCLLQPERAWLMLISDIGRNEVRERLTERSGHPRIHEML